MANIKIRGKNPDLCCTVCGKLAIEDSHFRYTKKLCNRHYLQMYRHGKIISVNEIASKIPDENKICCVCKDTESEHYTTWHQKDDYYGKVLCYKHYKQLKNKGKIIDPMPSYHESSNNKVCDLCGSTNDIIYSAMFQGVYCRTCYTKKHHALKSTNTHKRNVNNHTVNGDTAIIYFDNGGEVIVDSEDLIFLLQYKWHSNSWGYACARINNIETTMQHLLIDNPNHMIIDHINRNRLDNRKENLRLVNKTQNAINTKIPNNNTSGIIGVSLDKKTNKWRSYISINGKRKELGKYKDFDQAVKIRLINEKKYFGEFAPQQHLYDQYGIE